MGWRRYYDDCYTPQFAALGDPVANASVFGDNKEGLKSVLEAITKTDNTILGDSGDSIIVTVFGLPMQFNTYSGNVFVPLLMCALLGPLYKLLKKIIPSALHLVFVPFFSMLIMSFVTAFLIGPIGVWVGNFIGTGLSWLNTNAPFVFAIVIPLLYPFLVPLGLHWPLNALMLVNLSNLGYDFIQAPMGCWNFACFGATLGVLIIALREKDTTMRGIAGGALAAGLLGGVSEPSLYGIHLRYKHVYPRMLVGCAVGGITIAVLGWIFPSSSGIQGVTANAFAFTSLLTIPVFDQMWVFAISIAAAFTTSAVLVVTFDYRSAEERQKVRARIAAEAMGAAEAEDFLSASSNVVKRSKKKGAPTTAAKHLVAPVKGTAVALSKVNDPVFSAGTVGNGIAIKPAEGKIASPIDGKIITIAKNKHAFGIESPDGINVVVHVGIDSLNMQGEGLDVKVEEGAQIKAGDVLVEADFDKFEAKGIETTTMITVSNTQAMHTVSPEALGDVKAGDKIIEVYVK